MEPEDHGDVKTRELASESHTGGADLAAAGSESTIETASIWAIIVLRWFLNSVETEPQESRLGV